MEKGLIIAVSGRARAGKDTVGKMLAEELFNVSGKRFTLMAYAHELKVMCQKLFDLSYDQLWGGLKEVVDKRYPNNSGGFWTPREILQFYGTDCMRAIDNDFWVKNLFRVIEEKEFSNVIITDARFLNEVTLVKEKGGYIVNVTSSREGMEEVHGKTHASETGLDGYDEVDFHINNNEGFSELRKSVIDIVQFIKVSEKFK